MRSIIVNNFFGLTYKAKHNVLASLHKLTKQNTMQTRPFLFPDCKKVNISILFPKAFLGWKLSPIINKNVLGGKKRQ